MNGNLVVDGYTVVTITKRQIRFSSCHGAQMEWRLGVLGISDSMGI